jgi:hypothetical protein
MTGGGRVAVGRTKDWEDRENRDCDGGTTGACRDKVGSVGALFTVLLALTARCLIVGAGSG